MSETYVSNLVKTGLDHQWIESHLVMEARMGSFIYGANLKSSDIDVRGVFIPPREMLFPFEKGNYIYGFGTQPLKVDTFNKKVDEYDFSYFNITRFFDLLMKNSPYVMPLLFLREKHCTIYRNDVMDRVFENREKFLSKRIVKAYSGLAEKVMNDAFQEDEDMNKNMYLAIRLLFELESMIKNREIQFDEKSKLLSDIRKGYLNRKELEKEFDIQQIRVEIALLKSPELPESTNELYIRSLLWECLEQYYKD